MKNEKNKTQKKEKRICLSTLKSRGWTDQLISKFAPEPMYAPNPHYKCADEMQLFYLKDIERIEKHKRFKAEYEKVLAKKEHAKILESTREERYTTALSKRLATAFILQEAKDELREKAMKAKESYFRGRHNSCLWAYYNVEWVKIDPKYEPYYYDEYEYSWEADPDFMREVAKAYVYGGAPEEVITSWIVDYVLFHRVRFGKAEKVNYGTLRSEIYGRRISEECRKKLMDMLNTKVYSLIVEAYPFLQGACNDQLKFKGVALAA